MHGPRIGDDPVRPVQHALTYGDEADKARPTVDQQHTQTIPELLQAG